MKLAFFAADIMDVFLKQAQIFCFRWLENMYSANICVLFVLNQIQLGSSSSCEVGKANTSDLFLPSSAKKANQGAVLNCSRQYLLCSECNFRQQLSSRHCVRGGCFSHDLKANEELPK